MLNRFQGFSYPEFRDVPCRRNSVRPGQPRASDAIVHVSPRQINKTEAKILHEHISRKRLLEAVSPGSYEPG
jgi:hypothetical protein